MLMYIKMKHRVSFLILVVAMMIVAFAVCTSAASDKFEMSVESIDSTGNSMNSGAFIKTGDEIIVNVKLNKNPGMIGAYVDLYFDNTVLELVSDEPLSELEFDTTEKYDTSITVTENRIRYYFAPILDPVDDTGVLFSFKFKAVATADSAPASKFEVKATLLDADINEVDCTAESSVVLHNKHTTKVNPEIPKTCYSEGWTEEEVCGFCGEVLKERVSTGKSDHNYIITVPAVQATCTTAGVTEGKKCQNEGCTEEILSGVDPIKNHNFVSVEAKNATCTEMGWSAHRECDRCGEKDGYTEKAPLNHVGTITDIAGKEPTATEPGLTAGKQCYACQTWIQPQSEIPATGESASFPWVVVVIIVVVVAVAAVVVVYFTVIKKKNYKDDMFDDDDDEE